MNNLLFSKNKPLFSTFLFGLFFVYSIIVSLDFTGNSCFSTQYHKLTLSVKNNDTKNSSFVFESNYFIEEEDVNENELKKNSSLLSVFVCACVLILVINFKDRSSLLKFFDFYHSTTLKKILQLNCILRI
jgi:hypothetical protein